LQALAFVDGTAGLTSFTVSSSTFSGVFADSVTVAKTSPTFSGSLQNETTYGLTGVTVAAPTTLVPGSWSFSSSNAAVLAISGSTFSTGGVGTVTITAVFTPTNTAGYNSATLSLTYVVKKVVPTISITSISKIFGDSNFTLNNVSTIFGWRILVCLK
jgi:large repetitive protein